MRVVVVTPPEDFSVVTMERAKAHLNREGVDGDDALIAAMIAGAVASVDGPSGWLGRSLGRQQLEARFDGFDCGSLRLPYGPVRQIVSVSYIDGNGVAQTIAADQYELLGPSLMPVFGAAWPVPRWQRESVRVRYWAGYDEEMPVPANAVSAILLMIGDLFKHRETTTVSQIAQTPMSASVELLLQPLRVYA
ncbi:head-tail connector protein [Sphingomonas sp. ID0503]|uniref:head-tail connector protein n=1 Tax=Sphingomonas sp. ID0503 TaxID=3399691 RepID=UPI003AFAE89C